MILFYNKFFFLNITHVQQITHVHPKEGFFFRRVNDDSII